MAVTANTRPEHGAAAAEHVDVLIVGAGLSGIGAAAHVQDRLPGKRFAILEARDDLGGTWDLFRYPGIRSDSDMYTLGYRFKPWTRAQAIADGPAIKAYIAETAAERGIDRHIRYGHRVVSAAWSSAAARWTVEAQARDGSARRFVCAFLIMGVGYYRYDQAHRPAWPDERRFQGRIVHPQFWPTDLDYTGKRVVVIGSGATAVTLVPAMAASAAHVTMLQRSPTYVVSAPAVDRLAEWLKRSLPAHTAYALTRWKKVLLGQWFFGYARRRPEKVRAMILKALSEVLGAAYVARHFTPRYAPWDQRLCAVPDGDLFHAIAQGKAAVVTDTIERFTATGIRLASGDELPADIVVTATGLTLNLLGDVPITVDGARVDFSGTMNYKGCMFTGVPNLVHIFGYTNASWTLKADLVSDYACRLIRWMDRKGVAIAMPVRDPAEPEQPFLDFSSGYVQRALPFLPKQGRKHPWKLHQRYTRDLAMFRFGRIDDGALAFTGPVAAEEAPAQAEPLSEAA